MPTTLCIATGADAGYFDLLRGAVESVRSHPQGGGRLGVFDLGMTADQRAWAERVTDAVVAPRWHHEFANRDASPGWVRGLFARPRLPEYFPGADVYLWLDADAFVLDWAAVDLFVRGATGRGMAIVPELDRGSRLHFGHLPAYHRNVAGWYAAAFGPEVARELYSLPLLNAGVFAGLRDAPHWAEWDRALATAAVRGATLFTDQTALNLAVHRAGLLPRTALLPAWCNWGTHLGPPAWDAATGRLVEPCLPHTPIGILHLTGRNKSEVQAVPCVAGGDAPVRLRFPPRLARPELPSGPLPPGDYVSPGLRAVLPDAFFPNLTLGDPAGCSWPYLRRDVPHPWYVDRRRPGVGFVSRDEAAILFNTALRFRGRRALEVGGWLGWSACHLALGGVSLDVVDPVFVDPTIRASVEASLSAAWVRGMVNLVAAPSPDALPSLAGGRKWALMFIDGDHDGNAPVRDAEACVRHADEDALILLHDLAAPAVGRALDRVRELGWHTAVYHTMQLLGVAWRGSTSPIPHTPDPAVVWSLPAHLQGHPVV